MIYDLDQIDEMSVVTMCCTHGTDRDLGNQCINVSCICRYDVLCGICVVQI